MKIDNITLEQFAMIFVDLQSISQAYSLLPKGWLVVLNESMFNNMIRHEK